MKKSVLQMVRGIGSRGLVAAIMTCAMSQFLPAARAAETVFYDDFLTSSSLSGWQAALPPGYLAATNQVASYLGAPGFGFESLGTNSVMRLQNSLNNWQRVGWSGKAIIRSPDFRYEVRFNTLTQSASLSRDSFIEIWILDATNSSRYDLVSPHNRGLSPDRRFLAGSSIDGRVVDRTLNYTNDTYYRLVIDGSTNRNIRAAFLSDEGAVLASYTFGHTAAAFGSGFRIGLSQAMGAPGGPAPVDVALDYAVVVSESVPPTPPPVQVLAADGTLVGTTSNLTAALNLATNQCIVRLGAGLYSAASSGEVFPLRVDNAITIEAVPAVQPPKATVQGDGLHSVLVIESPGVSVRGLRITGGFGSGGIYGMDGGGICVFVDADAEGAVRIEQCQIDNNTCPYDETYDGSGGGIYCAGTWCTCFEVGIIDCVIGTNTVQGNGGGVFCGILSRVWMERTRLASNVAADRGGGVFVDSFALTALNECDVVRNSAPGDDRRPEFWGGKGAGVFIDASGLCEINRSRLLANEARDYGGGLFTMSGLRTSALACDATATNRPVFFRASALSNVVNQSLLASNTAGLDGGGAYIREAASQAFNGSTNYWNNADRNGGGVCVMGGEIQLAAACLLEGNEAAGEGGGVFLGADSRAAFTDTRFLGNSAVGDGGGVHSEPRVLAAFTNCLLTYNNSARGFGAGLFLVGQATNHLRGCTLAGNFAAFGRSGLRLNAGAWCGVTNSILWRNTGGSVDTNGGTLAIGWSLDEDGSQAAAHVISGSPRFAGWGAKAQLYVLTAALGPGSGTQLDPYPNLQVALDGFDFTLGVNSPCLTAADDGGPIGTRWNGGGAAGAGGVEVAALNLQPGSYPIRGRNLAMIRGVQGQGAADTVIQHGVLGYMEDAYLRQFSITGEEILGGLAVRANAVLEGVRVAGNRALGDGGGVWLAESTSVFTNCVIAGNGAGGRGGGGYLAASARVNWFNSEVSGNTAQDNGGGLQVDGISRLESSSVRANTTMRNGGGIFLEGSITVTNSRIVENRTTTPGTEGGGANVAPTATVWIGSSVIASNVVVGWPSRGGGLFCSGATTVRDCVFESNHADDNAGGAVCVDRRDDASAPSFADCQFLNNRASHAGAVEFAYRTHADFARCQFLSNSAVGNGGAIRTLNESHPRFDACVFQGNWTGDTGGAVFGWESWPLYTACRFTSNFASWTTSRGGTMFFNGWLNNPVIADCDISGSFAAKGGAVYCETGGGPAFLRSVVRGCQATNEGGAFFVREQTRLFLQDTTVSNCTATLGGGIYAQDTTQSTLERCRLISNVAQSPTLSADGGAVYLTANAVAHITCSWFENNAAWDDGGALAGNGSASLNLTNVLILRNEAYNSGGGVHLTYQSFANLQNCTFLSNSVVEVTTTNAGGGLYVSTNCVAMMDSSIFFGNQPDGIEYRGAVPVANYSCLQALLPGLGNFVADPLLDPLTLAPALASPCLDQGSPFPEMADACRPPGQSTATNDAGATGGPGNCCGLGSRALVHRYPFDNDANDVIGSAHGILRNGASIRGEGVSLSAANQQYVSLPAQLLTGLESVTIESWASFGSNGNWARLFDFGESRSGNGQSYIMFTPCAVNNGWMRVEITGDMGGVRKQAIAERSAGLNNRSNVHVTCVFDPPAHWMALYLDGELVSYRSDLGIPLSQVTNLVSWLGRSLYSTDAYLNGTIHEFRIYNYALTPDQVWRSYRQGPASPWTGNRQLGPPIELRMVEGDLQLSWPDAIAPWDPNWGLHSATNLSPPIAWSPVTNAVLRTDGQMWLTLPVEDGNRFFRTVSP